MNEKVLLLIAGIAVIGILFVLAISVTHCKNVYTLEHRAQLSCEEIEDAILLGKQIYMADSKWCNAYEIDELKAIYDLKCKEVFK